MQDNQDEELILGKYDGIGRVVATRHFDTYGVVGYGDFDADETHGYNTGQCIDVLVTEGVVFHARWHHQGETVKHICSRGKDIYIIGKPQVDDMVGFHAESYYAQIWERIEIPPGYTPSKRKRPRKVSPKRKPSATLPANKKVSREALKLETTNPHEALKLYSQLEGENSKFHRDIFTIGMLGFILGFIFVFYGAEYMGIEKNSLLLPLIWYSIGLVSIMFIWLPRIYKRYRGVNLIWIPIAAIFNAGLKIFEVMFFFFSMFIIALVPTLAIYSIIRVIHYFTFGGPFVFNLSMETEAVRWSMIAIFWTFFISSYIFLGALDVCIPKKPSLLLPFRVMKLKKKETLSTLVLFFVLVAVSQGWYSDNIFYYNLPLGLGLSVITGGIIAFAFASDYKDHLLANLYRLAKARCLIRMDRDFEAYYPLRYAYEDRKVEDPESKSRKPEPVLNRLIYATLSITENREFKRRITLIKWAPWGFFIGWYYIGTHDFFGIIHHRKEPVSHERFLSFTNKARILMEEDKYVEYRKIIMASIENTEKLEVIGNFPPLQSS